LQISNLRSKTHPLIPVDSNWVSKVLNVNAQMIGKHIQPLIGELRRLVVISNISPLPENRSCGGQGILAKTAF